MCRFCRCVVVIVVLGVVDVFVVFVIVVVAVAVVVVFVVVVVVVVVVGPQTCKRPKVVSVFNETDVCYYILRMWDGGYEAMLTHRDTSHLISRRTFVVHYYVSVKQHIQPSSPEVRTFFL